MGSKIQSPARRGFRLLVLLLFLLLPRYGMGGYLLSFALTHFINFALSIRRLSKISGCKMGLRTPLLAIAGTAVAVPVSATLPSAGLQAGAFVVIFLCILFLCKVLHKEDLHWVVGLIKRK